MRSDSALCSDSDLCRGDQTSKSKTKFKGMLGSVGGEMRRGSVVRNEEEEGDDDDDEEDDGGGDDDGHLFCNL